MRIYKSNEVAETYLFVAQKEELERVPEALLQKMGELIIVMEMDLHDEKQLLRVRGKAVLSAITAQGYYLQLPPPPESQSPRNSMHERFTK